MWVEYNGGATIGTTGSEDGVIIADEEHTEGGRITLERDGRTAPFSVTCGVYGMTAHTTFHGALDEAAAQYEAMRAEIGRLLDNWDDIDEYQWLDELLNRFP
jgi:hypothetical protein